MVGLASLGKVGGEAEREGEKDLMGGRPFLVFMGLAGEVMIHLSFVIHKCHFFRKSKDCDLNLSPTTHSFPSFG